MHRQEFHLIRASGGLFALRKSPKDRYTHLILRILLGTRAYFSHTCGFTRSIGILTVAGSVLPPTKNALDGVWLMMNLARIYALTGEKELALEQLEVLSKLASSWVGISYGELRLNPNWDSLRGDPRFEKLVEEAKKPVAVR
jgi:hypothetical protein